MKHSNVMKSNIQREYLRWVTVVPPGLWGLLYSLFSPLLFFPNLLFLSFILQQTEVNFTESCFTFSFCQDRLTKLSRKGLSFCLLSLTLSLSLSFLCRNIWQSSLSVSRSSIKWKVPESLDYSTVRCILPNPIARQGHPYWTILQNSFIPLETPKAPRDFNRNTVPWFIHSERFYVVTL